MSRSICIVFVALVIIQAAFANVAIERGITNLELTNLMTPETELINGERMSSNILGDMTAGQHLDGEVIYTFKYRNENYEGNVKNGLYYVRVPEEKTIHYVNVANSNGITAVICATNFTLGGSMSLFYIRQPPNSESRFTVNLGAH
ncbi:uncharacterized protein LOC143365381 [Halictus rubicundus]|uniref:uncharacterized protein LOC143365381 n=1 Tax=Halictus rubicundus TaxID=77578 RepID=UPI0040365C17